VSKSASEYVVIDVEGNGQSPPDIVEIACLVLHDLQVGAPAEQPTAWLVKPARPISPMVSRIHGIRNQDVADAPSFSDVANEVVRFLGTRPLVAHNASVEVAVLSRHLEDRWTPGQIIDTLRLAREAWPGLKSYKLDALIQHLGISVDDAVGVRHRAAYDVAVTAKLLKEIVRVRPELLGEGGLSATVGDDQATLF
jgi:DNA polymerase III epsilon subunit family exonuclease